MDPQTTVLEWIITPNIYLSEELNLEGVCLFESPTLSPFSKDVNSTTSYFRGITTLLSI